MKMDVPNTGSLASFEGLIPKETSFPITEKRITVTVLCSPTTGITITRC